MKTLLLIALAIASVSAKPVQPAAHDTACACQSSAACAACDECASGACADCPCNQCEHCQ